MKLKEICFEEHSNGMFELLFIFDSRGFIMSHLACENILCCYVDGEMVVFDFDNKVYNGKVYKNYFKFYNKEKEQVQVVFIPIDLMMDETKEPICYTF